jgi:hypothetical protein
VKLLRPIKFIRIEKLPVFLGLRCAATRRGFWRRTKPSGSSPKINDVAVAITGEMRDQVPLFGLERFWHSDPLARSSSLLTIFLERKE